MGHDLGSKAVKSKSNIWSKVFNRARIREGDTFLWDLVPVLVTIVACIIIEFLVFDGWPFTN